jgi:hypothetical protein
MSPQRVCILAKAGGGKSEDRAENHLPLRHSNAETTSGRDPLPILNFRMAIRFGLRGSRSARAPRKLFIRVIG